MVDPVDLVGDLVAPVPPHAVVARVAILDSGSPVWIMNSGITRWKRMPWSKFSVASFSKFATVAPRRGAARSRISPRSRARSTATGSVSSAGSGGSARCGAPASSRPHASSAANRTAGEGAAWRPSRLCHPLVDARCDEIGMRDRQHVAPPRPRRAFVRQRRARSSATVLRTARSSSPCCKRGVGIAIASGRRCA